MAQSERREAILQALYMRRHDTMGNLAHEFSVSRQTILSDINVLSLDHPEIEIRSGRWGGGVYIKNGFRSDRKYLKPDEKELLVSLRKQLDENQKVIMDGLLKRLAI
ncbi:HTH domain-containing protein [uncultured Selenomonas sp.]|uniref:HTH domain-containing protein n=1 Tax=uncultured Selenomonas sp. TaxID=159275 RepID=UPI0028DB85D1|nr:HTH domain-containing protein [uncultured Selenomonas sp.]